MPLGRLGGDKTYPVKLNLPLLIDRTRGEARSFVAETLPAKDTAPIGRGNIAGVER